LNVSFSLFNFEIRRIVAPLGAKGIDEFITTTAKLGSGASLFRHFNKPNDCNVNENKYVMKGKFWPSESSGVEVYEKCNKEQ
jgi:hypothetical protein